jgi:hypothetical protein
MVNSKPPSMLSGDLSDEQLTAIGKIVVEWAFLEWEIHGAFSRLAGFRAGSGAIANFIAAKIRRVETLIEILARAIPETWAESRKNRFDALLRDIKQLENARNRIVHCTWWGDPRRPTGGLDGIDGVSQQADAEDDFRRGIGRIGERDQRHLCKALDPAERRPAGRSTLTLAGSRTSRNSRCASSDSTRRGCDRI